MKTAVAMLLAVAAIAVVATTAGSTFWGPPREQLTFDAPAQQAAKRLARHLLQRRTLRSSSDSGGASTGFQPDLFPCGIWGCNNDPIGGDTYPVNPVPVTTNPVPINTNPVPVTTNPVPVTTNPVPVTTNTNPTYPTTTPTNPTATALTQASAAVTAACPLNWDQFVASACAAGYPLEGCCGALAQLNNALGCLSDIAAYWSLNAMANPTAYAASFQAFTATLQSCGLGAAADAEDLSAAEAAPPL